MKIVVADDEPDMRDYFVKILAHLGHEVVAVAEDGETLVDCCRRTHPELVITDLMMPVLSGDNALREIWLEWPVPAILISAYQCPEWISKADSIPPVRYLNKPINRAKLQSMLESFADNNEDGEGDGEQSEIQ